MQRTYSNLDPHRSFSGGILINTSVKCNMDGNWEFYNNILKFSILKKS
jgi:hypothetical protein